MDGKNKKIAFNTVIMYVRLIIVTIIGLFTSRFLLQALGASDYGLYSVVGGLIAILNVLSTAMTTTTRRFINVEMGKPDGNLNRIFNISRVLHIGFALLLITIAEVIGLFYINNYLNVDAGRIGDAVFVFQVSTIASAFGIYTVPFQSLLEANEKFTAVALVDTLKAILGLGLVLALFLFKENTIRVYAIGMGIITLTLLCTYVFICRHNYRDIVRFKFYKEKKSYREIIVFNNYVALGALSYMSRSQGSTMLVNYFFGTLVNAAFAIGYTMETYCIYFVTNIGTAAAPQITSNYENNNERSIFLTSSLHRLSVYMMMFIVVPFSLELNFVLNIWLKDVPEGALLICHLTLLSALARVVFGGVDKYIQASGKIKLFQIIGSMIEISCLLIGFLFFRMKYPSYVIILIYILGTFVNCFVNFTIMNRVLKFNVREYLKAVYVPIVRVLVFVLLFVFLYTRVSIDHTYQHLLGLISSVVILALIIYIFGLRQEEKVIINNTASRLLHNKNRRL